MLRSAGMTPCILVGRKFQRSTAIIKAVRIIQLGILSYSSFVFRLQVVFRDSMKFVRSFGTESVHKKKRK